jgi:uncharacterized protein (DUF2461 family)
MQIRVRTVEQERNRGWYRYRGADIHVARESRADCWYIQVQGQDGCYMYDGWWGESAGRSRRDAVLEAIEGACLRSNPAISGSR